ncbi:hypothetical protein B0H63DRAFT_467490 [Podospora didyma]|uniref:Uncharacterized protein n=1 Tax=Podospora didyma TaxID=330526 RepID=A0AAE0P1A8_9PEZI|nr:hypothetical protein B0H63DRAFT_467490 [Podospora didyma]
MTPRPTPPASAAGSESQQRVDTLLTRLNSFKKAPAGLVTLWQSVNGAGENSTAKIFLDEGGFPAWFAYILTKKAAESNGHFDGKAAQCKLIADLEEEPVGSRKLLASQLAAAIPSQVREKIDRLQERKINPLNDGVSQGLSKKRKTDDNARSSDRYDQYQHVLVNASLDQAVTLFPLDLVDSILRYPDPKNEGGFVAAISMSFPAQREGTIECQMALEITENYVAHFAQELFLNRVETKDGLRYLRSGRAKTIPNPKLTLTGCGHGIIPSIFGKMASRGIETSPKYRNEAKQRRDITDAVSMVISASAYEGATIFLDLGLWEGTLIKRELYI